MTVTEKEKAQARDWFEERYQYGYDSGNNQRQQIAIETIRKILQPAKK